jgi:hypothetical protein
MASSEAQAPLLRSEEAETSRLAWAFIISVALHLLIAGGFQTGRKLGWWQHWRPPAWLESAKVMAQVFKPKEKAPAPPRQIQVPMMFVDVSPAQAVTEPPKEAKYYSDKNSRAANPDTEKETNVPKIDGQQTHVVRTEDVPRSKAFPLNPTVPAEHPKEAQEEVKPKSAPPPGDLAMAKPAANPEPVQATPKETGEPTHARPKTVREALALPQNSRLAGEKMKQQGGVRSHAIQSSLDVLSTSFGAYDAAIIAAVQNCWYELLDSQNFMRDGIGKVTVQFHLNSDGTVTEVKIIDSETTVDSALALLCARAIKDPSPYARWPEEMRHQIGENHREVTFTFFYE